MSRKEPVGFLGRLFALGLGAIVCLLVVGISGAVFEFWTAGVAIGVVGGVVIARFAVREIRRIQREADPNEAAKRGSWEPRRH